MKIYDISQEVFTCAVWPTDPAPERRVLCKISEGAACNVTAFSMCAHNGTHVDAPYHFIDEGKKIDQVELDRFIGPAYVARHEGDVTAADILKILEKAQAASIESEDAWKRILVQGKAVMTEEAARVLVEKGVYLYGNESQTVGLENAPAAVHRILLGAGIVLLEGVRLQQVPEGVYLLNAAPINLGGADGAPCRAVLISFN